MTLRPRLLAFAVGVAAAAGVAAPAGAVDVPIPVPTAPTPTVPAPPPVSLPLPLPVPAPSVPQAPQAPKPPLPAAPSTPVAPATSGPTSVSTSGGAPSGAGLRPATSRPSGQTSQASQRPPRTRPRTIVLTFRADGARVLRMLVVQVAPECRRVGVLRVRVLDGANRIRFGGRVKGRKLANGTYVVYTPTRAIRFAIVRGRPTRARTFLQPSVCTGDAALGLASERVVGSSTNRSAATTRAAEAAAAAAGATEGAVATLPRPDRGHVLGTAFEEAAETALQLHPAFYALLLLAILVLAAATMPASVVPSAYMGAVLARRRAELTLAGTFALVAVIVGYLIALS